MVITALATPLLTQAETISINPGIPGVSEATDLVGIVVNIFQTALLVGAFLAFGSIVYGAVTYALSESGFMKSEAKDRIIDALIGLTLLVGAYMLLYVINPALTILKNPGLEKIAVVVEGTIPNRPGKPVGGRCATAPSDSACSVENLERVKQLSMADGKKGCNWDSTRMSRICVKESGALNRCSGTDWCYNGGNKKSFSCGLFQINLFNSNKPAICNGVLQSDRLDPPPGKSCNFAVNSSLNQSIGCCLGQWHQAGNSAYCDLRNCSLGPNGQNYDDCVKAIMTPAENVDFACKLFEKQQYQPWSISNAKVDRDNCN